MTKPNQRPNLIEIQDYQNRPFKAVKQYKQQYGTKDEIFIRKVAKAWGILRWKLFEIDSKAWSQNMRTIQIDKGCLLQRKRS
jgi:hypothetical protein